ncbi:TIGR02453 family protein [Aliiroseovarius halocynthiae]|uniref:TIGR02453 family protein n=1 Tax=Aliiroseovarius halocynthiae TaxID=985055 RepID=A0A545SRJ0_9RHOB|nr:TIGR02453 family protein [Aliiroseovarius halocynthiae]TQV67584.1 TIGR02453 family protein [Aliiroseovarius halocynthiae]SMR81600.1 TIGR02453 family protein [Aliiroseovarius halocynthiae]
MTWFSGETLLFLRDLSKNNSRDWFQANKSRYVTHVKTPAAQFSDALNQRLATTYGTDVKTRVFRMHRDLRFSKDKTPYNTHIHIGLVDAQTGASWMVGLQTDHLVVGFGRFAFEREALAHWRETVAGPQGEILQELHANAEAAGLRLSEPELKRIPLAWAADHPQGDLLRRKGIVWWNDHVAQDEIMGPDAPDIIARELQAMDPLRNWMKLALGPMA